MNHDISSEIYQSIIEREKMYRQITEYSLEPIIIHANQKVLYINQSGADFFGGTKEEILGADVLSIFLEEAQIEIINRIQKAMDKNEPGELIEYTILKLDGTPVDIELYCHPVHFGDTRAVQSVLRDITKRKEDERRHKKLLREINEVSSPIVPVVEGIAVLPLVGSIDSERAKQLLDILPSKIQKQHVEYLIIDFSGMYNLDNIVTDYLLNISAVMQMLGVRTIITGIRPEIAQIAVQLGINLSSTKTMATVQQALQYLGIKKMN
ncbi:PAS domain S-box protein [Jeotgalibacillus soli]|uniref:Histidine kinase n=1 Tax=Jeotgalibacillus soli TaxID=889306 RepID=A0A0C2W7F6_9BACL|nr:PAS domain S-box protein [Jeotgalibacillus soli]KIL51973.1 hypothetical protein KP78_03430 [Jeotgalibacillus soli]